MEENVGLCTMGKKEHYSKNHAWPFFTSTMLAGYITSFISHGGNSHMKRIPRTRVLCLKFFIILLLT